MNYGGEAPHAEKRTPKSCAYPLPRFCWYVLVVRGKVLARTTKTTPFSKDKSASGICWGQFRSVILFGMCPGNE